MDDFDFGYLEPKGLARFELEGVHARSPESVVLLLEHAAKGHPLIAAVDNAAMKNVEADVKALALLVVKGWENVNAKDGTPMPCTPETVAVLVDGLLKAKVGPLVWKAVNYALDPKNFRDVPPPEALGKH